MNKRKTWSVEQEVEVIREIENGEKRKLTCAGNLVSLILGSKRFGKTESKLLVHFNRTCREKSDYGSLNEVTSSKRCSSDLSNSEVTMYLLMTKAEILAKEVK
jgi:hypothetical protein